MNTVDSLLFNFHLNKSQIVEKIPGKDRKILLSLHKQVNSGIFLTERQANLLVKIIKENLVALKSVISDIDQVVSSNLWSKSFREIKKVRKIYIDEKFSGFFVVEFSYDPKLKSKISTLNRAMSITAQGMTTKGCYKFNEQNIRNIVSSFIDDGFEIDKKIMDTFKEIEEIEEKFKNPFEIFSTSNEKLKKSVVSDIGAIESENVLKLQDRKIRYQYQITEKIDENSLSAKIANRTSRKVFVNSDIFSFDNVVNALKELNRLPMLMVFDGHSSDKDLKSLKLAEDAVKNCDLGEEIGIYFRYDKTLDTKGFNKKVGELEFNKNLSDSTMVAGICNTKLPKFMIKMGWRPKTVVSTTYSFKNNKSYVYCDDVDLIVYYGNTQPLDKEIYVLV